MSMPAGWYDDGSGRQRWWDGVRWTENVAPVRAALGPAPARTSVLGFIGLALAVVGTVAACIPPAFLLGVVVLLAAFIVSVIALFSKSSRKWSAVTGAILSPVGGIAGTLILLVMFSTALEGAGDSSGQGQPAATSSQRPDDSGAVTPMPSPEPTDDLLPYPETLNPEVCAAFQEVVVALHNIDNSKPDGEDGWDEFDPLYQGLHKKLEEVSLGERKAVYADFNAAEAEDLFNKDLDAWHASNRQFVKVFNDDREWCEAAGLTDPGLEF